MEATAAHGLTAESLRDVYCPASPSHSPIHLAALKGQCTNVAVPETALPEYVVQSTSMAFVVQGARKIQRLRIGSVSMLGINTLGDGTETRKISSSVTERIAGSGLPQLKKPPPK